MKTTKREGSLATLLGAVVASGASRGKAERESYDRTLRRGREAMGGSGGGELPSIPSLDVAAG